MIIVIILSVATACLLSLQAIHILRNGDTRMFFLGRNTQRPPRPISNSLRAAGALMYGVPACLMFFLLIFAAVKNGKAAILGWIITNLGNLVGGVILFAIGLYTVLWPGWVLKGVQAAYPNGEFKLDTRFGTTLTRVLGALLIGFGLLVLSVIGPS